MPKIISFGIDKNAHAKIWMYFIHQLWLTFKAQSCISGIYILTNIVSLKWLIAGVNIWALPELIILMVSNKPGYILRVVRIGVLGK